MLERHPLHSTTYSTPSLARRNNAHIYIIAKNSVHLNPFLSYLRYTVSNSFQNLTSSPLNSIAPSAQASD
jgi:hypothetical protein